MRRSVDLASVWPCERSAGFRGISSVSKDSDEDQVLAV
jgi:hypothetical protein